MISKILGRLVAIGVVLGVVVAAETVRLTPELGESVWKSFLLAGPVVLFFAASGLVVGVVLWAAAAGARRMGLDPERTVSPALLWTAAGLLAAWVAADEITRLVEPPPPKTAKHVGYVVLGIASAGALALAWRRAAGSAARLRWPERAALALLAPALVSFGLYADSPVPAARASAGAAVDLAPRFAPEPPDLLAAVREHRRPRILWIGIDGASWDRIDRGIGAGRLPTFARLVERGRHAPLQTLLPTKSPAIWTTMMTGVSPTAHGISDFHVVLLPRLGLGDLVIRRGFSPLRDALATAGELRRVVVTSSLRRRKAIWNVYDEAGLRSAVLGLWATWPPEPLAHGIVLSDHAASAPLAPGVVHPPELAPRLEPLWRPGGSVTREELSWFLPVDDEVWSEFRAVEHFRQGYPLSAFRSAQVHDEFHFAAARRIWETESPHFLMVYVKAIDELSHQFYEAGVPEARELGRSEEEIRRYAGVIDRIYEWTDARLAELVELADRDPDTLLVVVSDHGWSREKDGHYEHAEAPPGILILYGAGVCRERCAPLRRPTVYDLAPTILWRARLPLSDEMSGRLLREAFTDFPPAIRVARYGRVLSDAEAVPSEIDEQLYEKLKALGYAQ